MQIEDPDRNLSVIDQITFVIGIFVVFLIIAYLFPKKKPQRDPDVTRLDSAQLDSLYYTRHPVYQPDSAEEAGLQAWQDSVFRMEDSPLVDSLLKKWKVRELTP